MKLISLACLAVLLGLTGCQGDPGDPAVSPVPISVQPTPSPTEPPPDKPERLDKKASAVDFVANFFDRVNYAIQTGDTQAIAEVSTPECVSCKALIRNIDAVYGEGGTIEGGDWETSLHELAGGDPRYLVLRFRVTVEPQTIKADERVRTSKGGKSTMEAELSFSRGWSMQSFTAIRSAK